MRAEINQVLNNDLCSGCGLCSFLAADNAVKMRIDGDGFNRPQISSTFKDQTIIASSQNTTYFSKSCPGLNLDIRPYKSHDYDAIWGQIKKVLRGYAVDENIRRKGSSGGVISGLAKYCLDQKLVDGVIQIKASTEDPLINVAVVNCTEENIVESAGSRYAPASPAEALKIISQSNEKKYLFIGKPCDVAAIRQLQACDSDLKIKIPYLVSFMCAGTPSIKGTEKVLERLAIDKGDVASFRYRGDGWPGLTKAILRSGESRSMTYNESWGSVLNRYLQTRCKICPDGIGEFADIVCADGWEGDENGYPSFDEKDGYSLILVRTGTGEELFSKAESEGVIITEKYNIKKLNKIQPFQFYRRSTILPRLWAMRFMMLKPPVYKGFSFGVGVREIGLYKSFKAFIGMLMRRGSIKKRSFKTEIDDSNNKAN